MTREYCPDRRPVGAGIGSLIRRQNGVSRVRHGRIARRRLQTADNQPIRNGLPYSLAKIPQSRGPDLSVIVGFVTGISEVLVRKRIAFVTLTARSCNGILTEVRSKNR